ncbi:MAG: thrombospondin type 3 repeat-containing protein [Anaerolineae bacterium]|jgi:hypothetical protein
MSDKQKPILLVLGLLILCALVALAAIIGYSFLQPKPGQEVAQGQSQILVLFNSPAMGEQVPVGRPVTVHAVASGAKIARVELWVDGQLHTAQNSSLPGGTSPFPLVTFWEPTTAGTHTLIARAFDAQGERAQAIIEVEAASAADRDGDGVADEVDACPDEPGWQAAGGCPDRDGDNVPDAEDACPDEAGLPENGGCPAPVEGDRDGDGISDGSDRCPDEPGMPTLDGCPMPSDRDGDEIADEDDACPDAPGSPETGGCPDRDGDTVPDDRDGCPDEAGLPESGCPTPAEGDRDGDGLTDGEDGCPDDPGPPENGGCPVPEGAPGGGGPAGSGDDADSDGDGIPDADDSCPGAPGLPEMEGCPDRDGDTVPDYRDMCPDEAGPPENLGCPEGTADGDGDGVPDDTDPCPDEAGLPEDGGCPPPEVTPEPGGPGPGGIPRPDPDDLPVAVEFQALSFQVSDDYDGVYCYPSLAGGPVERYPFEPLGEQRWDIAADLGSRMLATDPDQPIEVQMTCGADNVYPGDEGSAWGVYWGLGSAAGSHPASDWDGHVITVRSMDGDDGRWFEAQYRLCLGTCEDVLFQPPILSLYHYGGDSQLVWSWDNGDREQIDGFHVYIDGSRVFNVSRDAYFYSVAAYAPLCGSGRLEFQISAYAGENESPLSNMAYWSRQACPRVVRVTFEYLGTHDLGDDEWWAHGESVGPIYGNFWASGSTEESLSFWGVDYGEWWGERNHGYRLRHYTTYSVQSIFDTIWNWSLGMGSTPSPYDAPDRNYVTVELGPYDDLTFGGLIRDDDSDNPDDTLFDGRFTLPAGEVRPGRYFVRDRNITLQVSVDVIVGPEVGPEPDLTITNVDKREDQLRVHVFNNASDMTEPMDITVHWVRVGSSTVVDSRTWEDVQIPSGGSRILQSGVPVGDIGGMIFVLDPNEAIPDGNRGNNTFETPLTMRVEFLRVGAGHCSESGCSIFDCDSEWEFSFWAGYGPSESEISWVAFNERFPPSGHLEACSHDACMYEASSEEDYIMEGDDRYVFEFEMPAAENVYVKVMATELDFWTSDDHFASPFYRYAPRDNWGASSDPYTGLLAEDGGCNDALCSECGDSSVWARWRITKVE